VITSSTGVVRPLALEPGSGPLAYLDGHLVKLEGTWRRGHIEVGDWRVMEGLHGLPVWVGVVRAGPRLSLFVPDSGVTYNLDQDASSELAGWVGRTVLVEGYVEGGVGIRVMYYRPLFAEGG
jgi:hypothetical protein